MESKPFTAIAFLAWWFWSAGQNVVVQACPTGAYGCGTRRAAVGGFHTSGNFQEGSLRSGGFAVQVVTADSTKTVPLQFQQGADEVIVEIDNTLDFEIIVTASSSKPMEGVLIRVDDTAPDQVVPNNEALLHTSRVCNLDFNVGGVTHRSATPKSAAGALVSLDEPGIHRVDITVVVSVSPNSEFYYSGFILRLGQIDTPEPMATTSPTTFPSVQPVTEPPLTLNPTTNAPTRTATTTPTTKATLIPSIDPSGASSFSPTMRAAAFAESPISRSTSHPTNSTTMLPSTVTVPLFMMPSTQEPSSSAKASSADLYMSFLYILIGFFSKCLFSR